MSSSACSRTNARKYEIADLPREILLSIFRCYLSTNERKAVKLVSKAWFRICNVPCLLDNEVINCLGNDEFSDIGALLMASEREVINLKFQNRKFLDEDNPFWEQNGPKVRAIDFIDCDFQCKKLTEILGFCKNLSHMSLVYTSRYKMCGITPAPMGDLDVDRHHVPQNLDSLEIDLLESQLMSNYHISTLLSLFPNVKILKISCTVVDTDFEEVLPDSPELTNGRNFTFSPILNYLIASSNRIEKLKLHFPYNEFSTNFLHHVFEILTAMTRLTDLSISMRGTPQSEYVEKLIRSKQLKSLEFSMKMNSSLEKFLLLLLPNSGLEFLKISFFDQLIVTDTLLKVLMSSSLKSLNIGDVISIRDSGTGLLCSTPNIVLQNLSICTDLAFGVTQPCLLRSFKNLRHLKLSHIGCSELSFIFKGQTKLRSLIVGKYHESKSVNKRGGFRSNQFANVEYLSLPDSVASVFFQYLSPNPVLANLKYLRIKSSITSRARAELELSDLLTSVDAMPNLEALYVSHHNFDSVEFWVKVCSKLKRLRYLHLKADSMGNKAAIVNFNPEDIQKIFSACPSLRVIVNYSSHFRPVSYFFDTVKKAVIENEYSRYRYSLCVPRIDEVTVDWLDLF